MKRILITALVLGLLVVAGGLAFHHRGTREANMVTFESDMTEGLIQGIMKEKDADKPQFYFIAFGPERTDPSRLFIARFAAHFPQVRGGSSAFMKRNGQLEETSSGRTGVTIQVISLSKNKDGSGDAVVVFPKLPDGQNRFDYRLVDEAGKWVVKFNVLTK